MAQGLSHAPQSLAVFSARSQPSATIPLQSAKPGMHSMPRHPPSRHSEVIAFGSCVQSTPHTPQLSAALSDASQPFALSPSQLPRPC
jgi:hypothetical protein